MSLLTLVQNAARALNIAVPSTVVGNSDLNVALFLRLAQEEGEELSRRHDWQALVTEKTFTTVAAQIQTNALASDYDRMVPYVQIWNRTQSLLYTGPTSARVWQQLQVSQATGIIGWWRLRGGNLLIYPAPTAGETAAYEYVSKNFCESSGGTDQSSWAADTDLGLIPERLMTLGIIWRWKQTKGLAYAEDMATYEREIERATARDRTVSTLTAPYEDDDYPIPPMWNGTITP